jgi:hypothetical protein
VFTVTAGCSRVSVMGRLAPGTPSGDQIGVSSRPPPPVNTPMNVRAAACRANRRRQAMTAAASAASAFPPIRYVSCVSHDHSRDEPPVRVADQIPEVSGPPPTSVRSIDGAAEILNPVLALPVERRLDTLIRRMRDLGRLATTNPKLRTSPEGRGLHGRIMDFCATSAARQLPQ